MVLVTPPGLTPLRLSTLIIISNLINTCFKHGNNGDIMDVNEIRKRATAELNGDLSHMLAHVLGGGCEGKK